MTGISKHTRQNRGNRISNTSGFTLVELSIVLIIISVIAGSALTIGISKTEAARMRETRAKIHTIEQAMGAQLLLNRRLPCPADPTLATGNAAFGKEERTGVNCNSNGAVSGTVMEPTAAPGLFVGTVPAITLNLSDAYMFDGWGRRFVYAVDENFTKNETEDGANNFADINTGIITVEDNSATPNTRTTDAVYVVLSFGPNGNGGWLRTGVRPTTPAPNAGGETENAHDLSDFDNTFDATFAQDDRTGTFDDILQYRLKDQVIRLAGGVIDDEICTKAANTLLDIDYTTNPKQGPIGCDDDVDYIYDKECMLRQYQLADEIADLCF